jgi:hypothetical protein
MKFQLEIELGNDAMQTLDDVIAAIQASRKSLADGGEPLTVGDRDPILRDENGNTVGGWKVVDD